MNPDILNCLKKSRELIAAGWTRLTYAKDAEGYNCNFSSPDAVCFCIIGATDRGALEVLPDRSHGQYRIDVSREARGELRDTLSPKPGVALFEWNDELGRTKAEVLELFDTTIKRLEAAA